MVAIHVSERAYATIVLVEGMALDLVRRSERSVHKRLVPSSQLLQNVMFSNERLQLLKFSHHGLDHHLVTLR